MELDKGGGRRRDSHSSESSTDSWSVIPRRGSGSSVGNSEHELIHMEDVIDTFTQSGSESELSDSDLDSDIELEEEERSEQSDSDVEEIVVEDEESGESDGGEEIEDEAEISDVEGGEIDNDEEEEEEETGDIYEEQEYSDDEETSSECDSEEECESGDDDQMSVVDENELLDDSAALHYVSAEKVTRPLDMLAKETESSISRLLLTDRALVVFLCSLSIVSLLGISVSHIIGGTWLNARLQDIPSLNSWSGLQRRSASPSSGSMMLWGGIPSRAPPVTYPNCSIEEIYQRRERVGREIAEFIRSHLNNSCWRAPSQPKQKKQVFGPVMSLFSKLSSRPQYGTPSLRPYVTPSLRPYVTPSLRPYVTPSLRPTIYSPTFRPTLPRGVRPTISRAPAPTMAPPIFMTTPTKMVPPRPATSFVRRHSAKVSMGVCRRPLAPRGVPKVPTKVPTVPKVLMAPPPPVSKKYRHFTQNASGICRSGPKTVKFSPPKNTSLAPRRPVKFQSRPKDRQGPVPPPKRRLQKVPHAIVKPSNKFEVCRHSKPKTKVPQPCHDSMRARKVATKYELVKRVASDVCVRVTNTSRSEISRKKRFMTRSSSVSSTMTISKMARTKEPQCDRRARVLKKRITACKSAVARPCFDKKQPAPCKDSKRFDRRLKYRGQNWIAY